MKRLISLLLALCLLAAPIAAYAEDEKPMHVNIGSLTKVDGNFFTAQFGNNTADIDVRHVLHGYNPIVWSTQLDFVPDPMVVKGISESMDAHGDTVYTVTLQEDLCWNDGSAITAADYVFSYLLQAAPQFAEIGADIDVWRHIRGWDAYAAGDTDCLKGVRLLGDYRFSVTVKADYEVNFYDLSMIFSCPYPMDVLAPGCRIVDSSDGARIAAKEENAESPFTAALLRKTVLDSRSGYLSHPAKVCGPYSLKAYNAGSGTVDFVINEYYKGHDKDLSKEIQTIRLLFVKESEAVKMVKSGKLDILNKVVSLDTIKEIKKLEAPIDESVYDRLGYGLVTFACEKGPQQYQAVRQAIACMLDAEGFAEDYLGEYGQAVYGYYGIGQWMYKAAAGDLRPTDMDPADAPKWDAQNLNSLDHYELDLDRALTLLEADGWTLNKAGKAFDPQKDKLRYKRISEDELMPLKFSFGLIRDNAGAKQIADLLAENLKKLGGQMTVTATSFQDVLADYFTEKGTRKFDMSFLASNFVAQFDCVTDFYYDDDGLGTQNISAIKDEELLKLAWDMHKTAPGDVLGYLTKWVKFQQRFNEVLPTLPVYSNRYVDFFSTRVHNYDPEAERGWPEAILDASIDMA